ncbi:hypothetical protein BD779DRAFT_1471320 [Infundibulicybe gibba]|nr:hypothetical protein BD779DRAFT_1471320 [Infundibulicybe gibba]
MSLRDGIYTIREVTYNDPNPGVGGIPGEVYRLESLGNTTQPALYGFSWRGENPEINDPVILDTDLKRFTLTSVEIPDAVAPIYLIRPVINLIGVDIFVGARRGGPGEVQFQLFPVGAPMEIKPVWAFTPIPRD